METAPLQTREGYLVITAARSIQEYIFRSDKLKEMIGASELIEELVGASNTVDHTLLDHAAKTIGINLVESDTAANPHRSAEVLTRAGGGARLLFHEKSAASEFLRCWPLLVGKFAPGLEIVQAIQPANGSLLESIRHAEQSAAFARNLLSPSMPVAGPLIARNPRSGLPGVGLVDGLVQDAESQRKIQFAENSRRLLERVAPEGQGFRDWGKWPTDFARMCDSENSYLAIVHADANSLGRLFMTLASRLESGVANPRAVYRDFSRAITEATEAAVQTALCSLLNPTDPVFRVRPIVCAGDDLTVILGADLAMNFAKKYLLFFEETAENRIKTLADRHKIPELAGIPITACAGVAFVKKAFPFAESYRLCESLCVFAKTTVGRNASAIAFDRVTASVALDYEDELERNLTVRGLRLSMNPYTLGKHAFKAPNCALLDDLGALMSAMNGMPRGSFRNLVSGAYSSLERFKKGYERIVEVARARDSESSGPQAGASRIDAVEKALEKITNNRESPAFRQGDDGDECSTPIMDVLELQAAGIESIL